MESEFEDKGIAAYARSLELADAISIMNQYQKQKEEILRRQEEDAKRKAEIEEHREAVEEPMPVVKVEGSSKFVEPEETLFNARYDVTADAFQIVKLESTMREYGIEFRRVQ